MTRDLTSSKIDRQNILNNGIALESLKDDLAFPGFAWENDVYFTKQQVADIFSVDIRTIERYLETYEEELKTNGYATIRGAKLQFLKATFGTDINVGTKTTNLGIFSFRSVLNLAMLLTESEQAKHIRQRILDVVIGVLTQKAGRSTTFINQRDADYLMSSFQEKTYRKTFTAALNEHVNMGNYKYAYFTDLVYESIFREKTQEYRKILRLNQDEKIRETMYTEVLQLIASIENGFASEVEREAAKKNRKLSQTEATELFNTFSNHPAFTPLKESARAKMASRDHCFRDALHSKLQEYISAVPREDFERFLGETSKTLEARVQEARDVFLRLKDK